MAQDKIFTIWLNIIQYWKFQILSPIATIIGAIGDRQFRSNYCGTGDFQRWCKREKRWRQCIIVAILSSGDYVNGDYVNVSNRSAIKRHNCENYVTDRWQSPLALMVTVCTIISIRWRPLVENIMFNNWSVVEVLLSNFA